MDYGSIHIGYNMVVVSNDIKRSSHKIHGTDEVINSGMLYDKDYIGMSNNSAVSYDVGVLKKGEKKEFSIVIFVCDNKDKNRVDEIEKEIGKIKKIDIKKELQSTKGYWKKYLKSHIAHNISTENKYKEKIKNIYKRTILLFPLLTNAQTGGISAAMEIDEGFSKCR